MGQAVVLQSIVSVIYMSIKDVALDLLRLFVPVLAPDCASAIAQRAQAAMLMICNVHSLCEASADHTIIASSRSLLKAAGWVHAARY